MTTKTGRNKDGSVRKKTGPKPGSKRPDLVGRTDVRPPIRESKFSPEMCDQVIEWGMKGKSLAWMASRLGIVPQTIYKWKDMFPEFKTAIEIAHGLSQAYWEDLGQKAIEDPEANMNAGLYAKSMSARFPKDWSDRSKTEISGVDGKPIEVARVTNEQAHEFLDKLAARTVPSKAITHKDEDDEQGQ